MSQPYQYLELFVHFLIWIRGNLEKGQICRIFSYKDMFNGKASVSLKLHTQISIFKASKNTNTKDVMHSYPSCLPNFPLDLLTLHAAFDHSSRVYQPSLEHSSLVRSTTLNFQRHERSYMCCAQTGLHLGMK